MQARARWKREAEAVEVAAVEMVVSVLLQKAIPEGAKEEEEGEEDANEVSSPAAGRRAAHEASSLGAGSRASKESSS